MSWPAYLALHESGELRARVEAARSLLDGCRLCPRACGARRIGGEVGACGVGVEAAVASYGPHFGEESPLVGSGGSGTIFFSHCNLFCIFCQNFEISHGGQGDPISAEELAEVMVTLQKQGCHNINFVTPSHVLAQILEALPRAIELGLRIPLVYNCGGYERVTALKLLAGIVDIYMPDFKFWDEEPAHSFCDAPDYAQRARDALREMHRQVGDLQWDKQGVACRGLLVRHLVMPGGLAGSRSVLNFIAREISPNSYVNLMDQYRPCGQAVGRSDIGRRITSDEYEDALRMAREAGLKRLDRRNYERRLLW